MAKVKFCGITNLEDASFALDLGVDALGFNFYSGSPRYISPENARELVRRLPSSAWLVGVFVNAARDEVERIAGFVGLDTLQFHGDEAADYSSGWPQWRILRAVRLASGSSGEAVRALGCNADYLMLDSYSPKLYGGSGLEIDSGVLGSIAPEILRQSFLCGGLTPANVAEKIVKYAPYGVDVAGGIETAAGRKDKEKMAAFMEAVRSADAGSQNPGSRNRGSRNPVSQNPNDKNQG